MQGLELARAYYEEFGAPMLHALFPELEGLIAVGLVGSGSECLGYDDETSRDHDFEPGFCIFLPDESVIDRRTAFRLERAYTKLPKEFMGIKREMLAPVGGVRHGVLRTAEFFNDKVGAPDGSLAMAAWLTLPEHYLAEAVNGKVFFDNYGEVTRIREQLSRYPEDIKRKKLAGHLLLMAQSGQYNYVRCIRHGEKAAAQLAAVEFVKHAMAVMFLLSDVYQPYYKWSFRALRELPDFAIDAELMEYIITTDNEAHVQEEKYAVIEGIATDVTEGLVKRKLTTAICTDLEKHAYAVNDGIKDGELRNMNVLAGV